MTQDLHEAFRATAESLGLSSDKMRVEVGRQLQMVFAEACGELLDSFPRAPIQITNDLDLDERRVRAHLSGENKPDRVWVKYVAWFQNQVSQLKPAEQDVAIQRIARAELCHSTLHIWFKPGRPSTKPFAFPKKPGDANLVLRAISALQVGQPFTAQQSADQALTVPPDLQPPSVDSCIARPVYEAQLVQASAKRFAVILQGAPGAGKRSIVWAFLQKNLQRVLWFHVSGNAGFGEVLQRLGEFLEVKATPPAVYECLAQRDLTLVIDGISASNSPSFLPALQAAARMRGPARLLVCSRIRLDECEAIEVGALQTKEIVAFAEALGRPDLQALARSSQTILPSTLKQVLQLERLSADEPSQRNGPQVQLTTMERQGLSLLMELGIDVDLRTIEAALAACGEKQDPAQFAAVLESKFALAKAGRNRWTIDLPQDSSHELTVGADVRRSFLAAIGSTFEEEVWRVRGSRTSPPGIDSCQLAYAACKALQLSGAPTARWRKLLTTFSRDLRAKGMISQLRELYEYEVQHIPKRSLWTDMNLGACLHVQGELEAELQLIERVFHSRRSDAYDPNLSVHLNRAFAELLIDLGHAKLAVAILDATFRSHPLSDLQSTIASQVLSTLSWALIFCNRVEDSLRINLDVLGKEYEAFETRIARAVRLTRVGVAYHSRLDHAKAIEFLTEAHNAFSGIDRRGAGWTAMHLAEVNRRAGHSSEACRWYLVGSEISASHMMLDPAFVDIARSFSEDNTCAPVMLQARQEFHRLAKYEAGRIRAATQVGDSDLLRHLCASIGVEVKDVPVVDVSGLRLLKSLTEHRMATEFNRSLVRSVAKDDPHRCLTRMFGSRSPQEIFQSPLLNKLVTTACKNSPALSSAYVSPHLNLIAEQTDSIRLHFARHLETVGNVKAAEQLLDRVAQQDCFDFFNIKANLAFRDRARTADAMTYNEMALARAQRPIERMRIRTNMARTLYEHRKRAQFDQAIGLCEQAIEEDVRGKFRWPADLLLMLRLELEGARDAKEIVTEHIQRCPTTLGYISREVIPRIRDRRAQQRAINALKDLGFSADKGAKGSSGESGPAS